MTQLNFDATQIEPDFGFEIVPAGWYNAMIDESEMKPTKDGSGAYLQFRFTIIDGQYVNRKIYMRLNLRNTNSVAQEIAYKQLSAIAHAVNVLHIQDSSQLHGLPMKIKVKIRKDTSGRYEDSNEITSIKSINEQVDMGSQAGASQSFQVQQPQQMPSPQSVPQQPWQQAPDQQPTSSPQRAPIQTPPPPQPWQQPATAQPWQQGPQQGAPTSAPADFNPQTAVPPWAQPQK